jgi:hypothetical protein
MVSLEEPAHIVLPLAELKCASPKRRKERKEMTAQLCKLLNQKREKMVPGVGVEPT